MKKIKVLIVGSGFAGLCMAIKLKEAGINDFVVLEKAGDLGGTWRENTYPGAECDIPSALYSYSFEHNADWEFKWSGQKQIHKYQHDTAAKHGLGKYLIFNQAVVSARYDRRDKQWLVTTDSGDQYLTQHFVTAVGQLHYPSTPKIADEERYQGVRFHSAQWDHSIDLRGKRIGVIGNAASAVQFIPEIAKIAKHVTVFQRSSNWMLPKLDRAYAKWEQILSAKVPAVTRLYRWYIWAVGEYGVFKAISGNRFARWVIKTLALRNIKKYISDPELISKLTPDYIVGAKRILFSDFYYEALARDNVSLNAGGIGSFTETGIKPKDGVNEEFDVVIYGTGFKTNPFLASIDIQGTEGQTIRDAWVDGAHAYLGMATHGFPNMHMLYGPNTNLGHTSIIIMLEAQVDYVIRAIEYLDRNQLASCDVKLEVEQKYNQELQARLASMAFSEVEHSWYMDGNKITNNWAGGTREYERCLGSIDWNAYTVVE